MAKQSTVYTDEEVVELLEKRVAQAGSMFALAQRDPSLAGMIHNVRSGQRPPTMPRILELLDLELVFRRRQNSN